MNKKPDDHIFSCWHKGSKVSKIMYHATRFDFEVFDTTKGDLGAHFGTCAQANHVAASRLGGCTGVSIIPVWLRIENPLRLKDVGSFHADGIAIQLERKGLIPKGQGKLITDQCDKDWTLRKHYDPLLLSVIKEAGFDGVVYANSQEGAGDSYIVFESNQIKYALSPLYEFDEQQEQQSMVERHKFR